MTQKIKVIIPVVILLGLFALLYRSLFYADHTLLPSSLIGQPLPEFALPNLWQPTRTIHSEDLKKEIYLLNVWASWCYACAIEMPLLHKIRNDYHISIIGINYKDDRTNAINWLAKNGDPYDLIVMDQSGDTAIDLGVYGTPETFVVSPNGKIIYRHVGVIDETAWNKTLYPLIQQYTHGGE